MVKDKYTLEFEFQYEHDDDTVSFALMVPYTYEDLNMDSHAWCQSVRKTKQLYDARLTKLLQEKVAVLYSHGPQSLLLRSIQV